MSSFTKLIIYNNDLNQQYKMINLSEKCNLVNHVKGTRLSLSLRKGCEQSRVMWRVDSMLKQVSDHGHIHFVEMWTAMGFLILFAVWQVSLSTPVLSTEGKCIWKNYEHHRPIYLILKVQQADCK